MRLPHHCPSCGGGLKVTSLTCPKCDTRINGEFPPCPVCSLDEEDRALLDLFLSVRGNAKEIERALKVSYPTVRARLERLWSRFPLEQRTTPSARGQTPLEIMQNLRDGSITADEAERLLRSAGH